MLKVKGNSRLYNLITGLLCQFLSAVSGLILPNLVLRTYGSVLNGLVSTITQMMAYLSLVEMGIAAASLVSLYKPMVNKDYIEASTIFSAINKYYQRIALYFSIGALGCGIIAPFIIKDDIPNSTIWFVIIALAASNFISYWFLNKYKVLLRADDKLYIVNVVQIIGTIIQFSLSLLLINCAVNISLLKGVISLTYITEWFLLFLYCKRRLPDISLKQTPQYSAIKQRKDIIVHQVLALVLNNTDVILLTIFSSSLSIVSVYSIYAMVMLLVQNIANSFIGMFSSRMGQFYSIGNYEEVKKMLNKYELIYNIALFSLYICMAVLIMPFISIYTANVTDVLYYQPTVGLLFAIYGITRMLRLPYTELTNAAGHFKETKIQAILEASINLIVSIILIPFFDISGVLIGSICGEVYRTIHSYIYCNKKILSFDWIKSIILFVINSIVFLTSYLFLTNIRIKQIESYFSFFVLAFIVSIVVLLFVTISNLITDKIYTKFREKKV